MICLYVDDLIYTRSYEEMCDEFKNSMMIELEMTDLGKMYYFLGIEVKQTASGVFIGKKKYDYEVLDRF